MISEDKWQALAEIDDKTSAALLELEGAQVAKAFSQYRALLYELVRLNSDSAAWAEGNGYPLVEDYPHYSRAREIAKNIFESTGFGGLQKSLAAVKRITTRVDESVDDFTLIEYGWHDIGGWQT